VQVGHDEHTYTAGNEGYQLVAIVADDTGAKLVGNFLVIFGEQNACYEYD
jgi:hypothetical protein